MVLRDRKLNIAPAIKKQSVCATNGPVYYAATPPAPINNIPLDQFAAVYPPGTLDSGSSTLSKRPLWTWWVIVSQYNGYKSEEIFVSGQELILEYGGDLQLCRRQQEDPTVLCHYYRQQEEAGVFSVNLVGL